MAFQMLTAIRIHGERPKPFNIVIVGDNASSPSVIAAVMAARTTNSHARIKITEQVYPSVVLQNLPSYPEIVDETGALCDLSGDPRYPTRGDHVFLFKVRWKDCTFTGNCDPQTYVPVEAKDENCAWGVFQKIVGGKSAHTSPYQHFPKDAPLNFDITVLRGADPDHQQWAADLYDLSSEARASLNFRSFIAVNVPPSGAGWDVQAEQYMKAFDPFKGSRPNKATFTAAEVRAIIAQTLPKDCSGAVMSFALDLHTRLNEVRS